MSSRFTKNESTKPPVIFLMGPTAAGKTELAVALCQQFPIDIINVDSAQVYRGMDIGTAKPDADTLALAPHRLIDIRDPAQSYSSAEFVVDARREIDQITQLGRIPLLVGGTMLYFKMLVDGMAELPAGDEAVRTEILASAEQYGWPYLHDQLVQLDPESAANLHPNHSQRIQRALEVYRLTGVPMSRLLEDHRAGRSGIAPLHRGYAVKQLALLPTDRSLVHRRIARRFETMLADGLLAEVEQLHCREELHTDLPSIRSVGYRQVWGFLDDDYGYEEMIERGVAATRQLAKRQFTWLRGWPGLQALEVDANQNGGRQEEVLAKLLKLAGLPPMYKGDAG